MNSIRALRQGQPVVWHLSMFAVALALPILVFVGFLLFQYATVERGRLESQAAALARSTAQSIDRELAGQAATLEVLALSAYLQSGDLKGFYDQARSVQQGQGTNIVLRDMTGQMLVNTRADWGAPLPATHLAVDDEVKATGKLQISGVFDGPIAREPLYAVMVPVRIGGEIRYLLNLSLEASRITKIVLDEQPTPGSLVAVVDRAGKILGRNIRPEEFVGQDATKDFTEHSPGRSGSWRGKTVDGYDVIGAYYRVANAGWRVAVGVEESTLNAPIRRSVGLFLGLGLILAALSTVFALWFAGRIAGPLHELSKRADALGLGEMVQPISGPLLEVNEVSGELASASARLKQRESELLDSNEEVQRFAYIVSHDLRAPLVNIMGFTSELEALRDEIREPAETPQARQATVENFDESLSFIKAAIVKMDALIGAILKISREGRRAFRIEPIDTTGLVRQLADSIRFQAEASGATIEVRDLPQINSDRLALQQIFGNLLDNAVKYLDPERAGRISISATEGEGRYFFMIRDNGRGIAERDLSRVFELFRRAGVQDKPGEGIGLAHVRALVRALGGRIDVTSRFGVGTTFTVTLPRSGGRVSEDN